jgi:hypothetical protein
MKITDKPQCNCKFEDIKIGECFMMFDSTFMRINTSHPSLSNSIHPANGVDLMTGNLHRFSSSDMVLPLEAELIIHRKG